MNTNPSASAQENKESWNETPAAPKALTPTGQKESSDNPLHEAVFDALDASMKREIDQNVATVFMEAILLLWFCWQPEQIPTRHEDGRLTWREKESDPKGADSVQGKVEVR